MKVLVVAAHCDDETLGCGGTIAKHAGRGDEVYCLIMAGNYRSPDIGYHFKQAAAALGIKGHKMLDMPDMELEKHTLWEITQQIETYVEELGAPDVVYTHSANDLSQDHRLTFQATLTALRPVWCKPFSIYSFESPSSTEWSGRGFAPQLFVDVRECLQTKLKALRFYITETKPFPHPRSSKSLRARAIYWGAHCGLEYAEAFEVVREVR